MNANFFKYDQNYLLESGDQLPGFQLAYHTVGSINATRDNVIWVCHALTANSDVSNWWPGLYGPNKALDPTKYFIICVNVLGSCYGSTEALSINGTTGEPYYHSFPSFTIKDIVGTFELLRKSLGIEKVHTLIGGSLGGQQVLEWAVSNPLLFERIIPIATNACHSPWGIAFNETQRMAINLDPTWHESKPYAGMNGMKTARATALLSYRDYKTYGKTQKEQSSGIPDQYKAASYQQYQGDKIADRFNAFSYWYLSKAMDSHHLGRNRKDLKSALKEIKAKTLVIGINSDNLFPTSEQIFLFNHIEDAKLDLIDSIYGHDGFLIETEKLNPILFDFINQPTAIQFNQNLAVI